MIWCATGYHGRDGGTADCVALELPGEMTAREPAWRDLAQRRRLLSALVLREPAPRMEVASRWRRRRTRYLSAQNPIVVAHARIRHRDRAKKWRGIGMERGRENRG